MILKSEESIFNNLYFTNFSYFSKLQYVMNLANDYQSMKMAVVIQQGLNKSNMVIVSMQKTVFQNCNVI